MHVLACGPHRCCDGQRVAQWDGNSLERLHLLSAFLSPVSVSELGACATVTGWCLPRCTQNPVLLLPATVAEDKTLE